MSESKQDQPHSGDEGGGASRTPALEEPLLDDRKEDGLVNDDDASRPVPTPESIVPVREEEPLLLDDGAPPQQGSRSSSPPRRAASSNDEPCPGGKCATTAEACFKKIAKSTVGKIMLLGVLFAAGFVVGLTSLKAQIATSRPRSTP